MPFSIPVIRSSHEKKDTHSFFLLVIFLCFLLSYSNTKGQIYEDNRTKFTHPIKKTGLPIKIDGKLDDLEWGNHTATQQFLNQWPVDTGKARVSTNVRICYDNQFIYVGIACFDQHNKHVIQTLKRDSPNEYFNSDAIGIVIDPINKRTNGFFFGVSAGGAQVEGLVTATGTTTELQENWDNKWYSSTTSTDTVWFVEMAIPFSSLRYDNNNKVWGLNFVRNDMKGNTYSSWAWVPVNLNTIDLGFNGALIWDETPPSASSKASIVPYAAMGATKDYLSGTQPKFTVNAGGDAKIAVTSSLNLDLTINPDFSNVDVDRQITNLTRFSLFFPERRNFFIENSDIFTAFGYTQLRPFFSRQIGLVEGQPVPIQFGARLTGNLTDNLRIGLMDIQTDKKNGNKINASNYGIIALQQRILKRSSIRGMFINKQETSDIKNEGKKFNRLGAVEFNYLSDDGKWSGDIRLHQTGTNIKSVDDGYQSISLTRATRKTNIRMSIHRIGTNYVSDVGFIPRLENYDANRDSIIRLGFTHINNLFVYNFFPKKGKLNIHGPRYATDIFLNPNGSTNERQLFFSYYLNFKNQTEMEFIVRNTELNLPFSTFIAGNVPLQSGKYHFTNFGVWLQSDPRKSLSTNIYIQHGSFYAGTKTSLESSIKYRRQPWGSFSLTYNFDKVDFQPPYQSENFHLLGARMEISFSNAMFWTTFLQYNTQLENMNINSRFQWRYKPMSDLFLVYTDNYTPELKIKNRGFVMKTTYWLNL